MKRIRQLLFAIRYKVAVRKANRWHENTGRKFLVISIGGRIRVMSKHTLKSLVARGYFKRGLTIQDIESKALYITD